MQRTQSFMRGGVAFAFVLALASAALFGAATPLSKQLLSSVQPLQLAGLLGFGSVLVALPLTVFSEPLTLPWRLTRNDRWRLYASLGLGGTLGPVLHLAGLQLASAGSVSMWLNLELVFTAALAAAFFGERLSNRGWLAVIGAVCAACLLSIGQGVAGIAAGLLVAAACFCWGVDNNCTATIRGISAAQIVFWKGLASGIVNTSLAVVLQPQSIGAFTVGMGVLVGVFSFGVSIMLYIVSARSLGALRTQTIFSSAPFWGLGLSVVFLGEVMTPLQIGAAVTLICALVLLSLDTESGDAA